MTPTIKPFTVILAERNRFIRDLLCRELVGEGYEVKTCGLGRDAAALASAGGDVLVLDQDVADTDSAGVVRQVRALRPDLPVVVHAHSVEEAQDCLLDAQVAYIPKEQDPARLLRAVRKALEKTVSKGRTSVGDA